MSTLWTLEGAPLPSAASLEMESTWIHNFFQEENNRGKISHLVYGKSVITSQQNEALGIGGLSIQNSSSLQNGVDATYGTSSEEIGDI